MPWWVRIARLAQPRRSELAGLGGLMVISVLLEALLPWPLKYIVDYALVAQPLPAHLDWLDALPGAGRASGLLAWLAAGTVLIFVAARLTRAAMAYVQAGVGGRLTYTLGAALFDRVQRLSIGFHARARSGDLVRRLTVDINCASGLLGGVALPLLSAVATLLVMAAIMWQLDPGLCLIALAVALPLGVLIRIGGGRMAERGYQQQQLEGEVMAMAETNLGALPVVQAFGREQHEDQRFRGLSRRTIRAYLHTTASQVQFKMGVQGCTALGTAIVFGLGGWAVLQNSLTLGSLLVFLAYLTALYTPLEQLAYLSEGFAGAKSRARRVLDVLDSEEAVSERANARVFEPRTPGGGVELRLQTVSFGYQPGQAVLDALELTVGAGETLALVGPTGAGKSTLISLVPRFFDPWAGRVLIDGQDVRDLTLASLRAQVSLVLQEPFLMPLSIAENIAYGRPQASREEVVAAAVAANAHTFIQASPEGYDTVLGERGVTLSGGERQRLSIARALLKDAPVLILDEPTAALDAGTEAAVMEALERLMRGRTVLIIAHRLSTVRRADRIAVMEAGRIVESGSHDELMAARGSYRRLHALQFAPPPSESAA